MNLRQLYKSVFPKHDWFESYSVFTYHGGDGRFVLTCNIHAMFRILSVTRSLTCYARAILRCNVICMIARAFGEAGRVYEAIARAHAYLQRLYNIQDKAGH